MSSDKAMSRFAAARATGKSGVRTSKAEEQASELLNKLGIEHSKSVPYGRWILDIVLKSHAVVIEVHGAYWHDKPSAVERDQRKRQALEADGYEVIFWRTDQMHLWWKDILSEYTLAL